MMNAYVFYSLCYQDLVPNIHMIDFPQILERKSKKKKESRYLQQQAEPLNTQESICLGRYKHGELGLLIGSESKREKKNNKI